MASCGCQMNAPKKNLQEYKGLVTKKCVHPNKLKANDTNQSVERNKEDIEPCHYVANFFPGVLSKSILRLNMKFEIV